MRNLCLQDPTLAAWLFDVKKTKENQKRSSKHAHNKDFSQGKEDHIYIRIPGQVCFVFSFQNPPMKAKNIFPSFFLEPVN